MPENPTPQAPGRNPALSTPQFKVLCHSRPWLLHPFNRQVSRKNKEQQALLEALIERFQVLWDIVHVASVLRTRGTRRNFTCDYSDPGENDSLELSTMFPMFKVPVPVVAQTPKAPLRDFCQARRETLKTLSSPQITL